MMVEIEAQPHCANCGRQVHEDWIICPTCRNRLRRVCPNCSRLVELDWSLCAWCGKDFENPAALQEVLVAPPKGKPAKNREQPEYDDLPSAPAPVPQIASSSIDTRVTEVSPRAAAGDH
jgi:RNA polymerase subunit RPABC4/transcription elongation factor Spt4